MKAVSCLAWILVAFLVMACVDTVPDPPAVNPHTVQVTSLIRANQGDSCEKRVESDLPGTSSPFQLCWTGISTVDEPDHPGDSIVVAGHATDTSPPAA